MDSGISFNLWIKWDYFISKQLSQIYQEKTITTHHKPSPQPSQIS